MAPLDDIAPDNRERYRAEYARSPSPVARRLEEAVFGRGMGVSGYTTVDQAQRLVTHLHAAHPGRVLDVGAGRGWPGSYVTEVTGCRLVATDVVPEGLVAAKKYLETGAARGRTRLVAADGRALPFQAGSFDAVIHADVFC